MLFTPLEERATDKASAENTDTDGGLMLLLVHPVSPVRNLFSNVVKDNSLTGLRTYEIIIIVFILLLLSEGYSFASEDGFGPAKKIEGKNFTIYYAPELEISNLSKQLNVSPSDKLLMGKSTEKKFSPEGELAEMLDILFVQVCDILDMRLYSFRGNIKISRNHEQMNRIYNNLFNKDLRNRESFYVYTLNTIYISAENFKREIIGHEIGHAVISHYFVVPPSVKIQEVLAVYIEYQMRKMGQ